jgi:hypothetical protein
MARRQAPAAPPAAPGRQRLQQLLEGVQAPCSKGLCTPQQRQQQEVLVLLKEPLQTM